MYFSDLMPLSAAEMRYNHVDAKEKRHKIRIIRCKSAARLRIIRRFVFPRFIVETQPVMTGVFVCDIERFGAKNRGTQW